MVADNEDPPTIADDLVVTKYKMAAEITNSELIRNVPLGVLTRFVLSEVLRELVAASLACASVRELCMLGDRRLTEETGKAFKKDKKMTKGGHSGVMDWAGESNLINMQESPSLPVSQ